MLVSGFRRQTVKQIVSKHGFIFMGKTFLTRQKREVNGGGGGVIAQLQRRVFSFLSLVHHRSKEECFLANNDAQTAGLKLIQDAVLPHSADGDRGLCCFRWGPDKHWLLKICSWRVLSVFSFHSFFFFCTATEALNVRSTIWNKNNTSERGALQRRQNMQQINSLLFIYWFEGLTMWRVKFVILNMEIKSSFSKCFFFKWHVYTMFTN